MSVTNKFGVVFISCTLLAVAAEARAEGIFGGKTIGQRLDDLGHTIFGAGSSPEEDSQATQPTPDALRKTQTDGMGSNVPAPRAGSIMEPQSANEGNVPARTNRAERYASVPQPGVNPPAIPQSTPARPYRSSQGTSSLEERVPEDVAMGPRIIVPRQPAQVAEREVAPGNQEPQQSAQQPMISNFGPPPSKPIQNRLMQSRTSAFKTGVPAEQRSAGLNNASGRISAPSAAENSASANRTITTTITPPPRVANQPTLAAPPKIPGQPTLAKRPGTSEPTGVPHLAQRPPTSVAPQDSFLDTKLPQANSASNPTRNTVPVVRPNPVLGTNPAATAKDDALLFTRRGPVLSVETLGPRKIIVGKESTYEVVLANSGEAAEEVIVFVSLPEWAEVAGAQSTSGTPQFTLPGQTGAPFQWRVGRLEAKAKEKLSLRIIPRQSRPFDLAVRWDYKPVASQAMIEVQEPRLEMQLEGPRDVFYGKKESYRLKMMNTGTGAAEGVVVKLMPVGTGENTPAMYQLGVLPAGESKTIEIELTARQAGELNIQVEAKGDAGLHAELAERVLVRRAGLEVVVEGPRLQYVGATGAYTIRVRNPGDAPAVNVRFTTTLPAGIKYVGGIEGLRADASGTKLLWVLDSLNPQLEQVYSMKCRVGSAGIVRLDIAAAAEDELNTTAGVSTQVDSAASLSLDVVDPAGPVSIGDETVYEVRIRNRGTKDAESVEVLSYFSRGIEPTGAEGGPNRIGPGQVAFAPLTSLAPGAEVIFKVRAKAETAGNHVFRAEVHCRALGTRLISEKNTLYYQDTATTQAPGPNVPSEANRTILTPENYRTQRR